MSGYDGEQEEGNRDAGGFVGMPLEEAPPPTLRPMRYLPNGWDKYAPELGPQVHVRESLKQMWRRWIKRLLKSRAKTAGASAS